MALPNIFDRTIADGFIAKINQLQPNTQPQWGKMNATQMLAHCNITYEYAFDERNDAPNFLMKLMLKLFVKSKVINEVPYEKSIPTSPAFIINDVRNFDTEKARLIAYINKVVENGEQYFDGKKSSAFGVLTKTEWNNMLYKHLEHHFSQFGL